MLKGARTAPALAGLTIAATGIAVYLYKEIARELGVSIRTVETHVSAVLRKLHLSNRQQLARWATVRRLID